MLENEKNKKIPAAQQDLSRALLKRAKKTFSIQSFYHNMNQIPNICYIHTIIGCLQMKFKNLINPLKSPVKLPVKCSFVPVLNKEVSMVETSFKLPTGNLN